MRENKTAKANLEKQESGTDICMEFLQKIDKHIRRNWRNLKCNDICSSYFRLYNDLKEFRGNSNGFTGFSEFLIFRLLYYSLGGKFERHKINKHISDFVSKLDNNLRISQGICIPRERCKPDIVIYYKEKIIAIVQIKVVLTNGLKELRKEMETFEKIKHLKCSHQNIRALLVIFLHPSDKCKELLEKESRNKKWFSFIVLKENEKLLWKELKKSLNLKNKIR